MAPCETQPEEVSARRWHKARITVAPSSQRQLPAKRAVSPPPRFGRRRGSSRAEWARSIPDALVSEPPSIPPSHMDVGSVPSNLEGLGGLSPIRTPCVGIQSSGDRLSLPK